MRKQNIMLRMAGSETFAFLVIAVAAFVTRLYPLSISPYPFNNDSMTECVIASDILESGRLDLFSTPQEDIHSLGIPAFNILIAYVSSVIGASPLETTQLITAAVGVVTVCGIFLLARAITGSPLGGVAAGFMAIMLGTFVYTTGSGWKEALAASLMIMAFLFFVVRSQHRNRIMLFVVLLILPLSHHLVAVITFLAFALAICWSWYVALVSRSLGKRHLLDVVTIGVPLLLMALYYWQISFDSLTLVTSSTALLLAPFFALALCGLVIVLLSRKTHLKLTFAPAVGIGIVVLLILDYFGFFFSYTPSAPALPYLTLMGAMAVIITLAWYGTEMILETRPLHRAVQLCLLVAPLALMGVAFMGGFSYSSQKVLYRTFDFLDIALFIGAAYTIVYLRNRRRLFVACVATLIVGSTLTFPFGYESQELLGVRHDTQPYELDALLWIAGSSDTPVVVSDERIAYVSRAVLGGFKNPFLPEFILNNQSLPPQFYVMEDSWTTSGVNDYPRGLVVIPEANFTWTLWLSNVVYVGGPSTDRLYVFVAVGILDKNYTAPIV